MTRDRATLSFDIDDTDFAPKTKPAGHKPKVESNQKIADVAASKEGFTSRTTKPKIDGRTLRRTGRGVQFNISVSQETKDQFWVLAQKTGCISGGEFLEKLIANYKSK